MLISCSSAEAPEAVQGVLDAGSWNPQQDGMLDLRGEWEMYWMEFIEPSAEIRMSGNSITSSEPVFVYQPALWNTVDHPEGPLPAEGYASFRLRVKLNETWPEVIGIRVLEMSTSFAMYVNGQLVSRAGSPGTDRESTNPQLIPQTNSYYRGGAEELDIVLHAANFLDREGGRRRPVLIGTNENAMYLRHRSIAIESLIAGALLLISLYHLILYLSRRDQVLPLSFALVCAVFAARGMLEGERIMLGIMQFPFLLYARIWFSSYYLIPPAVLYFLHNLFEEEAKPAVFRVFTAAGLIFTLVTFLTDMPFITHMLGWYHPITIAALAYGSWLLVRAMRKGRPGSTTFLISIMILGLAGLNDMLYSENIIESLYLSPVGILSFVCFQAYYIASRFSFSLNQVQELSARLKAYSGELEIMAADRTRELQERTQELEESISYAQMIQKANLQEESDLQKIFTKSYLLHYTSDIIGGNFYQFSSIDSTRSLVVGDSAVSGVPGAMMAMQTLSLLRSGLAYMDNADTLTRLKESLNEVTSRLHTESNLLVLVLKDAGIQALVSGCGLFRISNGQAKEIIPAADKTCMFQVEAGESLYLCNRAAMQHAHSLRPEAETANEAFLKTISELAQDHFGNHRQKLIELLGLRNGKAAADLTIIGLNYIQ
ncbi:7TM diverse intracellular signaling domain-containing protein [Spirochaeta dissipatitropha]